jgi:hypothetical protein
MLIISANFSLRCAHSRIPVAAREIQIFPTLPISFTNCPTAASASVVISFCKSVDIMAKSVLF